MNTVFFEMGSDIPISAPNSFAKFSINRIFCSGESLIPFPKLTIIFFVLKSILFFIV
jgi:hypothetical protein